MRSFAVSSRRWLPAVSWRCRTSPPSRSPPETREAAQWVYQRSSAEVFPRSREEIATFFDGLEMVRPGLVNINFWPEKHDLSPQTPLALYGGAGLKR